jgi:hypothetical protein
MESINRLTFRNIAFKGELQSGIFPIIPETLVVRDDYSLGFRRQAPPEGYPIYNGKATYKNWIDLSNRGLRGSGALEYMTSVSESDDFVFLPKETTGIAQNFTVKSQEQGTEYPDVNGSNIKITFIPDEDKLISTSLITPIHGIFLKISDELMPPKAKLFDMIYSASSSLPFPVM